MEFQAETGAFGLVLGLIVSAVFTLVLPVFAVKTARKQPVWLPLAIGFILLSVSLDILFATQLFDIAVPHRDPFLTGMTIAGLGLCVMVWPLMVFAGPFRPITKIGFALLLVVLVLVVADGALRTLDPILLWIGGGPAPGPVTTALNLAAWERPAFGLLAGVTVAVFAAVLATTSIQPIRVEGEDGTYAGGFKGGSPGVRKASRAVAVVACLVAALYGFSLFFDAALGTSLETLFDPVLDALDTLDAVGEAWTFYTEWAISLFFFGALLWYAASEREWGCLTALVLALVAFITWAFSTDLFADWTGPFSGAWHALTGWYR